jgi:hypothetical protein
MQVLLVIMSVIVGGVPQDASQITTRNAPEVIQTFRQGCTIQYLKNEIDITICPNGNYRTISIVNDGNGTWEATGNYFPRSMKIQPYQTGDHHTFNVPNSVKFEMNLEKL